MKSSVQFCAYPKAGQHPNVESHLDLHQELDPRELQALFQAGAFWAQERTLEDLKIALRNSKPVVTARQGDRLVGFSRATSDGVYRATIWDVVVHPDYQGEGIGRKLVETLLSHPHVCRVERVYLMTTYQEKFYERVGFQHNASTTMVLQNHAVYNSASDLSSASIHHSFDEQTPCSEQDVEIAPVETAQLEKMQSW